ncbi:unnamed protein product [Adineta steineri]|uniref:Uncharacterized protein n=1 Tax=Adineta steineri TaxID=433720 RepID=A0A819MYC6_9BILA|nr:unnamed protein product [Adineta steineri]CAF3989073.1 unnamed protein product [Adineta steineri]
MLTVDTNVSANEQLPTTNGDQVINKIPSSDGIINTQTLQEVVSSYSTSALYTTVGYENKKPLIVWWIFTVVTGFLAFTGIPCLILLYIAKKRKQALDYEGARRAWGWSIRVNRACVTFISLVITAAGIAEAVIEIKKH